MAIEPILVWRYSDAPEEYRKLSIAGGDEDWVAFIPESYGKGSIGAPMWMSEGTSFGCCSVDFIEIKTGTVAIGSHA